MEMKLSFRDFELLDGTTKASLPLLAKTFKDITLHIASLALKIRCHNKKSKGGFQKLGCLFFYYFSE